MHFYDSHILSMILFTPLVGAILLLFVPRERAERTAGWATFLACSDCWFRCR